MSQLNDLTLAQRQHRDARKRAFRRNRNALFEALAAAGIESIEVSFDGVGDSGGIESVEPQPHAFPVSARMSYRTVSYASPLEVESVDLRTAVQWFCCEALEEKHGGWENGDGAYGTFSFDVARRSVQLVFNTRYTEVDTSEYDL